MGSVKMVQVVALHDLSYIDHNNEPQYRRQSSVPFDLDENNAKQFMARKAVRIIDEFDDDGLSVVVEVVVEEAAVASEASVNPVQPPVSKHFFGKKGKDRRK